MRTSPLSGLFPNAAAGVLEPPEAVTSATAAYLEAEDALAAWIEDCCDKKPRRGVDGRKRPRNTWDQTSAATHARKITALKQWGLD
jgi:hypothetical protein